MKNIVSRALQSTLSLDGLFRAVKGVTYVSWSKRESEYEDVYIRGMTTEGIKIRIVGEAPTYDLAVYFPTGVTAPPLSDEAKSLFLTRLSEDIQNAAPSSAFRSETWS